jgi:hypothetical protein
MSKFMRLATLALVTFASLGTAAAAGRYSVPVNRPSIQRAFVAKAFNGQRLELHQRLDRSRTGAGTGISETAIKKAMQTLTGYQNFNFGAKGANYVIKAGGQKWIVTRVKTPMSLDSNRPFPSQPSEYFVVRTGKRGIVLARGFVEGGKITWTRSHNERGQGVPSERIAR